MGVGWYNGVTVQWFIGLVRPPVVPINHCTVTPAKLQMYFIESKIALIGQLTFDVAVSKQGK
jgi:hypothetical protein